jgi:hypothetical protein
MSALPSSVGDACIKSTEGTQSVIVAVFARRLRPGVTIEQFVGAWAPEGEEPYPADVEVALDPADDRRILTIIRFAGGMPEFRQALPRLVHPESRARLAELVESTELEGVYETADIAL